MTETQQQRPANIRKPSWLKSTIPAGKNYFEIKRDLRGKRLATVCEEAKCPNIGTCWNQRTATFMLLGEYCTRACRFCNVKTQNPKGWLDTEEPQKVADSCAKMGLDYVVLTMVDRDDLPDGGADHVSKVIAACHDHNPKMRVEILAGDFAGQETALATALSQPLDVFAHNIETVERLSPRVRDRRADYRRSLKLLRQAKSIYPAQHPSIQVPFYTKSSIMLGLGETIDEVKQSLRDLREHQVDFVTLGQYMRPSKRHLSVKEWVHPTVFAELKQEAERLGFLSVASGPLVRSSYKAMESYISSHS